MIPGQLVTIRLIIVNHFSTVILVQLDRDRGFALLGTAVILCELSCLNLT